MIHRSAECRLRKFTARCAAATACLVALDLAASQSRSFPARSFFPIAPPVHGLNVVRRIVPPYSTHSPGVNVVRYDVATVAEPLFAESAEAILCHSLPVHKLPPLGVGTDLPIAARVMGIFDAADDQLARLAARVNCFDSALDDEERSHAVGIGLRHQSSCLYRTTTKGGKIKGHQQLFFMPTWTELALIPMQGTEKSL